MNRHIRYALKWAILDVAIVLLAYTAAYTVRALTTDLNYYEQLRFISFALITILVSAYANGVYHTIWGQTSGGHGVAMLTKAVGIAAAITVTATLVLTPRPIPLSIVLLGTVLTLGGMTVIRYRARLLRGMEWRWLAVWRGEFPTDCEHVLIIGAGESGEALARRMRQRKGNSEHKQQKPRKGYQVIGYIDDDMNKQGLKVEGYPVLGNRADIPEIVEKQNIELIVVAIHNINAENMQAILSLCEQSKAKIKVVPDPVAEMDSLNHSLLRDVSLTDYIGRNPISRYEGIDMSPVMGKRVLVTGAAGSIGSELSRQMATYDTEILLILDNNESALHDLHIEIRARYPNVKVKPVLADVTRPEMIQPIFEEFRPQVVYHAAAYKHVPMMEFYPNEAIRVNVAGTRFMAELARDYQVERFVLISTDKAVKPSSVMGASKRMGELLIHELSQENGHKTLFTAVRFGNVLGSRGSVVPTFNRQIDNGGPITVTHQDMTRYFMSIPESVNLVIHAACLTQGDDIFVLRMGETVHIMDIAERLIRLRGLRPNIDISIKITGIRPGEKLHEELHDEAELPTDTEHPYIFRMGVWLEPYQPDEFLFRLDALCKTDLTQCEKPLDEIMQVAVEQPAQSLNGVTHSHLS